MPSNPELNFYSYRTFRPLSLSKLDRQRGICSEHRNVSRGHLYSSLNHCLLWGWGWAILRFIIPTSWRLRPRLAHVTSPKTNTSTACKSYLALGRGNWTLGLWDPLSSLPLSSQAVQSPMASTPLSSFPRAILLLLHYPQAQFIQKLLGNAGFLGSRMPWVP